MFEKLHKLWKDDYLYSLLSLLFNLKVVSINLCSNYNLQKNNN